MEAGAIIAIVLLNAIIGVVQETRAEEALAALKKLAAPNAFVLRGGSRLTVPSRELVPGDVVILEDGNYVPADVRLVEAINLRIEEASLTGESMPVEKTAAHRLEADVPLGDRRQHRLYGHAGHPRARPGHCGGHRHAHPDGPDRPDAGKRRQRADAAAIAAGRTGAAIGLWRADHLRAGVRGRRCAANRPGADRPGGPAGLPDDVLDRADRVLLDRRQPGDCGRARRACRRS